MKNCNIENVACAGLDGYSDKEDNYINPRMEYAFIKSEAGYSRTGIEVKVSKKKTEEVSLNAGFFFAFSKETL